MPKRGRRYQEAIANIDRNTLYSPEEAIQLLKEAASARFDETIEVHMRLGIDPRHAEQQVREVVLMPAGLGKTTRIAVFAEGEDAKIAEDAGADIVGGNDLVERIQKEGFLEFDVAIAVPEMMGGVGRLGRVLGPRGLMPNPKAGTVVRGEDLPRVIEEARAGRVEFRNDKTANLHVVIGKASFEVNALLKNFAALMDAIMKAKPSNSKGTYIRKIVITSTMGPGIKIDPVQAQALDVDTIEI
jgi:large subunit ribosomal protein L1